MLKVRAPDRSRRNSPSPRIGGGTGEWSEPGRGTRSMPAHPTGDMSMFRTLAGAGTAETRVLGSRFSAFAFPIAEEAEARAVVQARERELFDASHHCSAWRLHGGL